MTTSLTPQTRSPETGRFAPKGNTEDLTTISFKVGASEALRLKQMAAEHQVTLSALLRLMTNQFLSGTTELLDLPPSPAALRAQDLWAPEPQAPRPVKMEPPPPPEPPKVDPLLAMLKAQQEAMAAQQLELTRALAQIAQATRPELPPVQAVNLPPLEAKFAPVKPASRPEQVRQVLLFLRDQWNQDPLLQLEVRCTRGRVFVQTHHLKALRRKLLEALPWVTDDVLWLSRPTAEWPKAARGLMALDAPNALMPLPQEQRALPPAEAEWLD